jgi:hypothetical protein
MHVKNWSKFQHYKHRDPPWIRLYRGLLNDVEWHNLDGGSAKALVMIWLIASESDGELPPVRDLAFRLRITEKQCASVLDTLSHWLVHDASAMLAECEQLATPETETETETETESLSRAETREQKRKKSKTAIDQDWQAPSAVLEYATTLGFSESEVKREVERFKNNALQNDRRCIDWAAALRNWFLKALEILGREIPQPPTATSGVYILRTDPRFEEWERATGRKYPTGKGGGWTFPTEKPPQVASSA